MLTLRITTISEILENTYVEIALEGSGLPRQTVRSKFHFQLSDQDQTNLQWYLEDYLQYPVEPASQIASLIEKRIAEIGVELFNAVFQTSDDARDLWATVRPQLTNIRIEIAAGIEVAKMIPWELIRDSRTDVPLVLRAASFVRVQPQTVQQLQLAKSETEASIRILLVICRPGKGDDVPFRSVANPLCKSLMSDERKSFQLDVLRPPTFSSLSHYLRQAKTSGKPYHIVHFDGHGVYAELVQNNVDNELLSFLGDISSISFSGLRVGKHGYVLFENPDLPNNIELIGGTELGNLLVETGVPVLVLNACRSAHAEVVTRPDATNESASIHSHVRAFGSLAQEIMDTGVLGVVAMRYNVYVVTAAQFIADLYLSLILGQSLGEAVTMGRKQLGANPNRAISNRPISLQDWSVPIVYEAAPIQLFPKSATGVEPKITLQLGEATTQQGNVDRSLPHTPDTGFWGRDSILLSLDRAFDRQQIVLLHGHAGSGKTSTAAEFARWYASTGGIRGPILFTSFEHHKSLPQVVDQLGQLFSPILEKQSGIHWMTLSNEQRRAVALQMLKHIPVLWIWDNTETIAGLPNKVDSAWTKQEQEELVDFLRAARNTKVKFLLTSRYDEPDWLGGLPSRIAMTPMTLWESIRLTSAIAEKQEQTLDDLEAWLPLLRFANGNPLTIIVVVKQALRLGLHSKADFDGFVSKLRRGETSIPEDADYGHDKSLAASLQYSLDESFYEEELRYIALLHCFQGFLDFNLFYRLIEEITDPESLDYLPQVSKLTVENAVNLLNRASRIGLLHELGQGHYAMHPAVPWFFHRLFERYYSSLLADDGTAIPSFRVIHAFVDGLGTKCDHYVREYDNGKREAFYELDFEEENLLQGVRLALQQGWWKVLIKIMLVCEFVIIT